VPTADQRALVEKLRLSASLKLTANIEVLTRSEVTALEGCDGNLETARWRQCGRQKAAAFSTSARWSAVGTYSAGISRSVSLN
jgi:hypothetical protein